MPIRPTSLRAACLLVTSLALAGLALAQTGQPTRQATDEPQVKPLPGVPSPRRATPVPRGRTFGTESAIRTVFMLVGNTGVVETGPGVHPSTVNTAQFSRSMLDANDLPVRPANLISLGGLVTNGADDQGATLQRRLNAWDEFTKTVTMPRFYAVPGRELMDASGKVDPAAVTVWREWATRRAGMPKASSQGPLNFTVPMGRYLLVFLDTVTRSRGMVDAAWLQERLHAAQMNRDVDAVFVFGNDPLVAPQGGAPVEESDRAFFDAPEVVVARTQLSLQPKVAAYFCGGPGQFTATRLFADRARLQITYGIGGGPLAEGWNPPSGQFFGFGAIVVYNDGSIDFVPLMRPVPQGQPSYADRPVAPDMARAMRALPLVLPTGDSK